MFANMREREEFSRGFTSGQPTQGPSPGALGLDALHNLCRDIYPEQSNPLTVTAIVKYWLVDPNVLAVIVRQGFNTLNEGNNLIKIFYKHRTADSYQVSTAPLGGPDPLDYISMYENPGCPELGVPPHWHYVSLGLSDLHGDGRLHPKSGPGRPSGFGFELTFRLVRKRGETTPPTWPANVMQQLAKYVFNSGNMLLPGDHVSWHAPLDNGHGKITQILMGRDPQLPSLASTPHGEVTFVQIVGVTSEELQAAQHWNGLGVVNLLKTTRSYGSWLVTDMARSYSVMEEDPSLAERIQCGIEREGSNLSGVSAKCWWVQMASDRSTEKYREPKNDSDDEEDDDVKPTIKTERLSPCENSTSFEDQNGVKTLPGIHLTFNLEAGSLLPLAIKGRVMHGRHFTFKSILSHAAVTIVAPSVTGTLVTEDKPYVVQGPWLQVLLSEDLAEKMAQEFQILNSPDQLQLPKTFSWAEYKLAVTIVND